MSVHSYDGDTVHKGVRNLRTGMIGCYLTATADVSTRCRAEWTVRPRRTLRDDYVTCAACLSTIPFAQTPDFMLDLEPRG